MGKKLISIILPVYNSEDYIEDTINSILKQTYQNFEIIIINDGSKDNSGKICENFTKKDKRIKYYEVENSGVSTARNIGLQKATGEYITFIDSDDLYKNNYLETLITNLEKNNADLITCAYETLSITTKVINYREEYLECDIKQYIEKLQPNLLFNQLWNKMYKLNFIKNNNIQFDTTIDLGEDYKFNLQYIQQVKKIIYINIPLYQYRITNNGLGFKYRKNSSEIKLNLLKLLDDIYIKNNYDKTYIYKNYIIQYLAYFSNIVDIRNDDTTKEKLTKIKYIIKSSDYISILKRIRKNTNLKYKVIATILLIKNTYLMYILGKVANIYDKTKKRKTYN